MRSSAARWRSPTTSTSSAADRVRAAPAALDRRLEAGGQERDQVVAIGGGGRVRRERQPARADEIEHLARGAAVEQRGGVGQRLALVEHAGGGELARRCKELVAAVAGGVGGGARAGLAGLD